MKYFCTEQIPTHIEIMAQEAATRLSAFIIFKILVFAILLFFLLPILFVLIFPIFIYRYFVTICAKIFKSQELGKILSARSAVFAVDDLYNKPRSTLLTFNSLSGSLDLNEFRKTFDQNVLRHKRTNGELLHPELQQHLSTWMGFHFWRWDKKFQINDHIRHYDGNVKYSAFSEETALEIANELVPLPFKRNQSPWELFVFPICKIIGDENPEKPKSAFMLRLHHSLADGNSIVKLITNDIGGEYNIETASPNYIKRDMLGSIWNFIVFPFRVPWDISKTIFSSFDEINTEWHLAESKLSGRITLAFSKKIPISYIKEVRDQYESNLSAIVMEMFTGAMRNLIIERRWKFSKFINLLSPLPVPEKSEKLRNHMTAGYVKLPIANPDPIRRLREIEAQLIEIKHSTFPKLFYGFTKLAGGLFPCMTKVLVKQYGPSALMTNFPGPNREIQFAGLPGLDCMLYGGFLPGNIGIGFGALSYNGNMRFTVGVDESILSKSDYNINNLMNKILEELENLKQAQPLQV